MYKHTKTGRMATIPVTIDDEQKKKFHGLCIQHDTTMTEVLRLEASPFTAESVTAVQSYETLCRFRSANSCFFATSQNDCNSVSLSVSSYCAHLSSEDLEIDTWVRSLTRAAGSSHK
jgi:hypothetical protein